MIIDAHQHYWKLDRGDYGWLTPEMRVLYRDYLPEDLSAVLVDNNVEGTVLVQAAPTLEETRFILDIARSTDTVLGVVGWFDMDAENAVEQLDELIEYGGGYLKGVRPMIQDIPDSDWLRRPSLDRVFIALAERGLVFDALVRPIHLDALEWRLREHPDLRSIVDHGGKPSIALGDRAAWSAAMGSLARNTSAYCKISGLVTQAKPDWLLKDIRPYISDLIYYFGCDRLIWGSDWPVLNQSASYKDWLSTANVACGPINAKSRYHIFRGNAQSLYGLEAPCLR